MVPIQNPLLVASFAPWFTDLRLHGSLHQGTWPSDNSFSLLPWANNRTTASEFLKKDAPWRNLQIQSPPVTTLVVERRVADRGADQVSRKTYSIPDGLRMGLLYDLTWAGSGTHEAIFGVRWDGIPLPVGEAEKTAKDIPGSIEWRDDAFVPKPGGEAAVLLEMIRGEGWFLKNYHNKDAVEEVGDWDMFKSEGMIEGEAEKYLVGIESVYEQVYKGWGEVSGLVTKHL